MVVPDEAATKKDAPSWEGVVPVPPDTKRAVARAVAAEAVARKRLARLQRAAARGGVLAARNENVRKNREVVIEMQKDIDKRVGRDLTMKIASVPPAKDTEVLELSRLLNEKMAMFPNPDSREWFRMFKHMDDDRTGRISFNELDGMVREELRCTHAELPESKMHALWRVLDADSSGFISAGEFGRFMRKYERETGPTWRERTQAKAEAAMLEVQADLDMRSGRALNRQISDVSPAGESEVLELSRLLNEKLLVIAPDPNAREWFKMFKHMDDDRTGRISYKELSGMIREELRLDVTDSSLHAVWRALDADNSGWISAGEFGRFMRKGQAEKGTSWKERLQQEKNASRVAVKQELDKRVGRDITIALAEVQPACEEDVLELSRQLNAKMTCFPDPDSREWFRMFKHMDDDDTGRISFKELDGMVREELKLSKWELPDRKLQALWRALDVDSSGWISAGEFGRFMRKGESGSKGPSWKERVQMEAAAAALEVREDLDQRAGRTLNARLAGVPPAKPGQVLELSRLLNEKLLVIAPDPNAREWFKMFKHMDDDRTGRISYKELSGMIREELRLTKQDISEAEIQGVWLALDADNSGWISAGEFGRFMRKGAPDKGASSRQQWQEQNAAARIALKQDIDRRVGRDLIAKISSVSAASEDEVANMSRLLNEKMSIYPDPNSREWFRMFKHMDDDGTGRISFKELDGMVREELKLSKWDVSEHKMHELWRALDVDSSGWISAGEFGRFMRKGETGADAKVSKKEQLKVQRHETQKKLKAEEAKRADQIARRIEGETLRLEEEAARLERALARKLPLIPSRFVVESKEAEARLDSRISILSAAPKSAPYARLPKIKITPRATSKSDA